MHERFGLLLFFFFRRSPCVTSLMFALIQSFSPIISEYFIKRADGGQRRVARSCWARRCCLTADCLWSPQWNVLLLHLGPKTWSVPRCVLLQASSNHTEMCLCVLFIHSAYCRWNWLMKNKINPGLRGCVGRSGLQNAVKGMGRQWKTGMIFVLALMWSRSLMQSNFLPQIAFCAV